VEYDTQRIVLGEGADSMPLLAPPKKIPTVEENAIVSADVRTILEAAGYDVCPDARDGAQALEHVRAYAPDLILLDLVLPRLDGLEAAILIREESDAPILVLTGHNDPEMLERAAAAGTSGLVLKPFSEHGLLAAVRSRLAERESDDFGLRCMVESMLRDGADEPAIIRAVRDASSSGEFRKRAHRPHRSLQRELRRLMRLVARRRGRAQ
jgi:two-component system, response regulator PdtaR